MSRRSRDVAIVGIGCRFPGAPDLFTFWENILAGRSALGDVPPDRWDADVFHDPESRDNDRVASRRGGYLQGPIPFDPAAHGIMPVTVAGGEPEQFLVLSAAKDALRDAGFPDGVPDGRRVEVVIGRGNYFNRGNLTRLQHGRIAAQTVAILRSLHPDWSEAEFEAIRADLKSSLPPFEAATIPGQLSNATAGLAANRLDLRGASFVVDAASASSLVALDLACRSLAEGRADLAIVGGVYLASDVDFPMVFSRLGALSRSGQPRPFSADADGTVPGEGVGVMVLKRLSEADRDGDRVYAILRGVGLASDGRSVGLTAPGAKGHASAMRRAYRRSGVDPASVGLIEGHGLGVPASDLAELRALRAVFPPSGSRVLGAVSAQIGHAMPAAGMAGLIKACLCLFHRAIPPGDDAKTPHRLLRDDRAPAALNPKFRPWIVGDSSPRRAAVNAFGFGGISAHAILEEHPSADRLGPGCLPRWDSEAILLSAEDRVGLAARIRSLLGWLSGDRSESLKDVAFSIASERREGRCRLGLVVSSLADLSERLQSVLPRLEDPKCRSIRDARGAYFWDDPEAGRLAFLFPGEGSQYPGMLADLCPHFPEVRALFDTADRIGAMADPPIRPSDVLFGDASGADLWSVGQATNSVLSSQWALYQILIRLGLSPDALAGHSSGEFLALAASGAIRVDRALEDGFAGLAALFDRLEASGEIPEASLVAVAAGRERIEARLGECPGAVVAMDNCPHQVVVAVPPPSAERFVESLRSEGVICELLPFDRAYHTPQFAPLVGPIREFFEETIRSAAHVPIFSCATAERMPDDPRSVRDLAAGQWSRPVRFRETIEAMYADGIRVFIDVGARGNLAGFVEDTLRGRPSLAVAANLPRRSGLLQLNHLVASLFAKGIAIDPTFLFARRRPTTVDLEAPPPSIRPVPPLAIGFPEMKLSEAMVQWLRDRPARLDPWAAEAARPLFPEALSDRLDGLETLGESGFDLPFPVGPDREPLADPAMLEYFRTMDEFLVTQGEVMAAYLSPASGAFEGISDRRAGPWAGELLEFVPGRRAVSRLLLDADGDPVAAHHTLGGRRVSAVDPDRLGLPVLPFSVMAEMLAEAASRLAPGLVLTGLRDVRANRWVRYEDEPIVLELVAEAVSSGEIRVSMFNRGPVEAMKSAETAVVEGLAVFDASRPEPPVAPAFWVPSPEDSKFTATSLYGEGWLFHGPALQALVRVGVMSDSAVEGTIRILPLGGLLRDEAEADGLLTDPIAIDNFTHLLGCWGLDRLKEGDVIFPLRMGEWRVFGESPPSGSDVACRINIRLLERQRVRVDAQLVRPDGSLWMAIDDWEDWRFHWPGRYRDVFRRPDRELLGEPLTLHGPDGRTLMDAVAVWLEPPADMTRPVWRDVLEQIQLSPDEKRQGTRLPEPARNVFLLGRIAGKEAVRRLASEDQARFPADLSVEDGPDGHPIVKSLDRSRPIGPSTLAIAVSQPESGRGMVALALATTDLAIRPGVGIATVAKQDREGLGGPADLGEAGRRECIRGGFRSRGGHRRATRRPGVHPAPFGFPGPDVVRRDGAAQRVRLGVDTRSGGRFR